MPICPQCRTGYPPNTVLCPADGSSLLEEANVFAAAGGAPGGQRAREVTDPLVGQTLADRFRVTRRIGEGGMGVVYEASHVVIGKSVALKVLHERYVERPEVAARLMNEAKLASSIHNEHIVDIFDFGQTIDGRTFVVMELLDGESLAARLKREGPLPEERALDIALQVSDAIGAAHERGVIHRDVKPENVFLVRRDNADFVKVVDFGISKTTRAGDEESPRLTHTGMILGTPLYMSPEQARGEDKIDHRIDVYALGVILYECLTGETPFRGKNYLGIIADVLNRDPIRPRELRPDLRIAAPVEQVILRAMEKDRERRYASMAELAADLLRARSGQAVQSLPPPPAPRPRASALPLVLLAVTFVSLVLAATVLIVGRNPRPSPGPAPAPPVAARADKPPAPPPLSASVIVKINSTPPGAEIFNGGRKLGVAPQGVELARSERPVHLTFRRDGYEDSATDVVPQIDGETINIELRPLPRAAQQKHGKNRETLAPHEAPPPQKSSSPAAHETLPVDNPYR